MSLLNQLRREAVEKLEALQSAPRVARVNDPLPMPLAVPVESQQGLPELHILVRTPEQLTAALELDPGSITLDYLDLYGLRPSIERIKASSIPARVASPRVLKPGESRILNFLVSLDCPIVVRAGGMLDRGLEAAVDELRLAGLDERRDDRGAEVSAKSSQTGHTRSPYSVIVTGAFGLPSTLPCWGMPAGSSWTFATASAFAFLLRCTLVGPLAAARADDDDHDQRGHRSDERCAQHHQALAARGGAAQLALPGLSRGPRGGLLLGSTRHPAGSLATGLAPGNGRVAPMLRHCGPPER